jgi:hypothetical protein
MSRPEEIEEEAVKRACTLARHSNVPIVIDQPTSRAAIEVIRSQKEKGQVVVGQASAASFVKNGSEYYNEVWSRAAAFVTSPPLRDDPEISEALLEASINDVFATVCSDHKAYTNETKKEAGKTDFTQIPHGFNGIEERMAVTWDKIVYGEKASASKFVALTSSNAAKVLNAYPQKGRVEAGSDADIVVWNPNNVRTISSKLEETESNADVNIFEGLTVHGAPEFVLANGRVVVYEYELSPNTNQVGAKFVEAKAYPSILYDQVQNLDDHGQSLVGIQRNLEGCGSPQPSDTGSVFGGDTSPDFGKTTPRNREEPLVLNKKLGIYQRPISAHGVRNQQDSTFSLAGGNGPSPGEFGSPRRTVKVSAPPGGDSRAFW